MAAQMVRFLSGAGLMALVLLLLFVAPPALRVAVLTVAVVAGFLEAWRLLPSCRSVRAGLLVSSLVSAVVILLAWRSLLSPTLAAFAWCLALFTSLALALRKRRLHGGEPSATWGIAAGLIATGLLSSTWYFQLPQGNQLLALVIWATWTGDLGAGALTGRLFSELHPVWPWASPGKNWEGVVLGTFALVIFSLLFLLVLKTPIRPITFCSLLVVTSVARPLGDLAESVIKRLVQKKDSGHLRLLPGHGGVLDRIDSLTLALPLVFAAWEMFP